MRRMYDLATRAAASDISVLVLGETGVGKEVMAETIHRRSPRADHPFLRLNCAALPESLLEGELFGHERGAFTGAHATKAGLLESTDRGTVFLDEIGELPLGTQAKLLRVLEERTVLRLGATKSRRIDVRFVTATNRELGREVRAQRFRGDLYYRITGLVVRIPPLRDRRAEIEPLARHFLREFCLRGRQPEPHLTVEAASKLYDYHWPGNVRELRNVIERATLLATEGQIDREHVMLEPPMPEVDLADADDFEAVTKVTQALDVRRRSADASKGEPTRETERDRVMRALESCGGNQTRAAKMLGVSRRTLINRLEEFQLPRPKKA
jgi:transcriptional regulator with PAS, ATPase and Fis domain